MKKISDIISATPLFKGLPEGHLQEIEQIAVNKYFNKDESIFFDGEKPFFRKHIRRAARCAQVAVFAGKDIAHFGGRAVFVIRQSVDDQRHSAGSVGVKRYFFIDHAGKFPCAFFDRVVDVGHRHIRGTGAVDGGSKRRIGIRVSAALLGDRGDFTDQFGKNFSSFSVGGAFFMFDRRPFRMT